MNNPLLNPQKTYRHEAIAFDEIKTEHFMPAFDKCLADAKEELAAIKNCQDTPTFDNIILALELSGETVGDVVGIYYNLMSAESDDEFKALAQKISPQMAALSSSILTDSTIFNRVKYVYDNQISMNLNAEQKRLVERKYTGFVRNGAMLSGDDKEKLMKIDEEMSKMAPQFSQNVLNATNSFELLITDEEELAGVPKGALEAAKHLASKKGKEGWMFNLQPANFIPIIQYCENRALREKLIRAYGSRAFNDEFDNQEIIKKIVKLRQERSELLGMATHADYTLTERMAENPQTVKDFLDKIHTAAYPQAQKETDELRELAKEMDGIEEMQAWDAGFYTVKLQKKKFDFDPEELRPYFKMENVLNGIFAIAKKMYNLEFTEINDIPVYHPEVKTYEVTEGDKYIGLLYMDLFPRDTKRGGAWMTSFKSQGLKNGKIERPHVSVVASLTPSTPTTPSLLRLSEVTTIFHEFGHALHGLLSDVTYSSLASPSVYWDFVELPSQIMENWAKEKEALELFAFHYETGEKITDELIQKIKDTSTFHSGRNNIRQLFYGFLDVGWHAADNRGVTDVNAHEKACTQKTELLPLVDGANISCSFGHIFAGGYAAGYYSYKWAEVLEADAFEKFLGDGIFNQATAKSFRDNILSKGNTEHPMDLYVRFRGRKPDADALLKRDKLI